MKKSLSPTAWNTLPFLPDRVFSVSHHWLGINASSLPQKTKANHQKSAIEAWKAGFKFLFSLEMGDRLPSEKCCCQLQAT